MTHGKKDGMQSNADKFESTRNVILVKGELFEQNVVEMDFFFYIQDEQDDHGGNVHADAVSRE